MNPSTPQPDLTREALQAIKRAAHAACDTGFPPYACPHPVNSREGGYWLGFYLDRIHQRNGEE